MKKWKFSHITGKSKCWYSHHQGQLGYTHGAERVCVEIQARVFIERINQELDYFKPIGYSGIIFTNTQMS